MIANTDLARAINSLTDYADDLDHTERPAIGEYDVTADIRKVCQALVDASEALAKCAAGYSTPPGTVGQCQVHINAEFQRRMDIAGAALCSLQEQRQEQP